MAIVKASIREVAFAESVEKLCKIRGDNIDTLTVGNEWNAIRPCARVVCAEDSSDGLLGGREVQMGRGVHVALAPILVALGFLLSLLMFP